VGRWFLVFLLLVIGATAGVAILYPEEFKQTYHLAKERLKPWIDRVKRTALGQEPESQAPTAETPAEPAPKASETASTATEEAKPVETPPKSEETPMEQPAAPSATTDEPPSAAKPEGALSSAKTTPPSSTIPNIAPVPASAATTVPGIIQVTSTPSGAEIIFDDRQSGSWMTPYTFQNVSKGRHTLEVKKSGYVPERRIVVLLGNESQRVSVVLIVAAGMLKVSTVPGGASIYVDGELKREVTPASLKISAGTRRILLRKEGYQEVEKVIEIEDNSITTLNQPLAPIL
jgi:PEGA domain